MTLGAAYAAMISRMDQQIGDIMDLLKKLGIDENTLMIFSGDNGTTFNGGSDAEFFNSVGPLHGLKCSLYEGGIRVPMIARWTGKIKPGTTTDHISAFWDILPTIAEIINAEIPADIDGISLLPALLGKKEQKNTVVCIGNIMDMEVFRQFVWETGRVYERISGTIQIQLSNFIISKQILERRRMLLLPTLISLKK